LQRHSGFLATAGEIQRVERPLAHDRRQRFPDHALVVHRGAGITSGHDHPVVALIGKIETGIFVAGIHARVHALALRRGTHGFVYGWYVIRLVEVVEHHLPVEWPFHRQRNITLPLVNLVALPVLPDGAQILPQAHAFGIHVHPDEPGKRLAPKFQQIDLAAGVAFRKVLRVLGEHQFAVRIERPGVVPANEPVDVACFVGNESIAAMLTDVVEGLDTAIALAHHQYGLWPHIFALSVAGLWNLRFPAQQQPDLGPHTLELFVEKVP